MATSQGKNSLTSEKSSVDYAIKMVRAIRLCEKAGVSAEVCQQIRTDILGAMDLLEKEESQASVLIDEVSHYELKIRQLVKFDAPWSKMEAFAWRYLELKPSSDVAAHLLELAFLHGDETEVLDALRRLNSIDIKFYSFVNRAVRNQLLKLYWKTETGRFLASVLNWQRSENWLIPSEKLFVLRNFKSDLAPKTGLLFYRKHQADITKAIKTIGQEVGVTAASIYLQVARYAAKIGRSKEAYEYLQKIGVGAVEYHDSLSLMLAIDVEFRSAEKSEYTKQLSAEPSWSKRIILLRKAIESTRKRAGFQDRNRPYLNILLRDPLKWVPELPDAWMLISETLACNTDSIHLLPEITHAFEANMLIFHDRSLDVAFWQPCIDYAGKDLDPYWTGVAYLHKYVASLARHESFLWEAKKFIAKSFEVRPNSGFKKWDELHSHVLSWMLKSSQMTDDAKLIAKLQLSVSGERTRISPSDIEAYLNGSPDAPPQVFDELEKIAIQTNSLVLIGRIVQRKSQLTHLRNRDLDRMFKLSLRVKNHDFAWRSCSILAARGDLSSGISHAWEISGENRKIYPITLPKPQGIEATLTGFNSDELKLCKAVLKTGGLLPELIAKTDRSIRSKKVKAPAKGSIEAEIDDKLNAIPWLPPQKKSYHFDYENEVSDSIKLPAFAKRIPNNQWSQILVRVIDRLGINSWGWRMSRLQKYLEGQVAFRNSRDDLRNFSNRSGKVLKNSSASQRGGLADFRYLGKKMSDEKVAECLAKFVCRLTTLIYQNHVLAINSVQNMRSPLPILWDLENWILSDQYSSYRVMVGTNSKVPVPSSMQSIASIRQKCS